MFAKPHTSNVSSLPLAALSHYNCTLGRRVRFFVLPLPRSPYTSHERPSESTPCKRGRDVPEPSCILPLLVGRSRSPSTFNNKLQAEPSMYPSRSANPQEQTLTPGPKARGRKHCGSRRLWPGPSESKFFSRGLFTPSTHQAGNLDAPCTHAFSFSVHNSL